MLTRRDFLARSALISLAPTTPAFLSRGLAAATPARDDRILVIVQLDGGNDGLNTVIPYSDENYGKYRRDLRIPADDLIRLNDSIGLHPAMRDAADLLQEGRFAIVQGVGYPNPDRSHFRSMEIWHTARPDSHEEQNFGWVGRAWDGRAELSADADAVSVGKESLPLALWGRRINAVTLNSAGDLQLSGNPLLSSAAITDDSMAAYVERVVDQSYRTAQRFREFPTERTAVGRSRYPDGDLGQKLAMISRMIKFGSSARVYYAAQTGYDTHAGQLGPHQQLLRQFSSSVKAFLDDLNASQLDDRVVVMAFSEFGRRVDENASRGTDHGAAGPLFLAGPAVRGTLIGEHPSLVDLDDGDLKMSIDFRAVYAELLDHWLQIPSQQVIKDQFAAPHVLKSEARRPS